MARRVASTVIVALVGSLLTVPGAAAADRTSLASTPVAAPATPVSPRADGALSTAFRSTTSPPTAFRSTTARHVLDDPDARLVFMRDCDVWIARPDGSGATNLTADVELCAIMPSISRTGRYVAYQVGVGSGSEVRVHDRSSGSSAPLAAAVGGGQVAFSPTADTLAFSRFDPSVGASNIFSVGVDGAGLKQWTFDTADGSNFEPSWSPDGSSILHTTNRGSWHCRIDQGGYYDLPTAYRLARATSDGAVVEVAGSDDFSIWDSAEGAGVLAYARSPMPPGPSGGICAWQPGLEAELVVNGEPVDRGSPISGFAVAPGGELVYGRGEDVVVRGADGVELAVFRGTMPDWGVEYGRGAGGSGGDGGGDDDGGPPRLRPPVARCDVYWTRPGTALRVPRARGLLVNDRDPEGRTIRPLVTEIGFRKASHPYTVNRDGSFTLQTLSSDRKLYLDYQVKTADGRRSATARATILVSSTKPSASALEPCAPIQEELPRDPRGWSWKKPPTTFPAVSAKNLDLLRLSMRSWDDWRHMLKNKTRAPYRSMDFVHDNCSAPLNAGNSWLIAFTPYCIRHDFAYRNGLWLDRFNEIRLQADRNFLVDLMRHCERYGAVKKKMCESQAGAFYLSVRKGGGVAAQPQTRKSYAGAGSVRIVTVFNPIDNFYTRGWVSDDKKDGADVRLEYSPAVTGFNPRYRTVAQTSKGKGTRVAFDFSYNGLDNLKGVFFRICTVEDRKATCGPRFYANKPD